MQMKGEDCCPLLQWITPTDFCKNGLAARQTQLLFKFQRQCVSPAVLEELRILFEG